ncbi:MAG: alpha/beta fold hydrolase, partial [Candidatus Sericytochromatia bacterium]
STRMPIYYAVGSSLVGVTAFGLTTAFNYALDGWVDWPLAAIFIGGGVLGYRALAEHLGAERPFYAFQAAGLEDDQAPLERVDALAERYVAALSARQPEGPVHLIGWSFGGLIAFEMARQLQARGREVAALVLIDSHLLEGRAFDLDEAALLAMFERDVLAAAGLSAEPAAASSPSLAERLARWLPEVSERQLERHVAVFKAHARAAAAYEAAPFAGRLVYLQAEDGPDDALAPWMRLADGLSAQRMPGDHYGMMAAPHVATLAAALRALRPGP